MKLGADTLREQIAERERARAMEQERRERESRKRVEDIERAIEEDAADKQRKRVAALKLLDEINAENEEQIKRKAEAERAERAEDERVMEYLRLKAERDAAKAAEEEAQRRARELETARLRSMQEKYIDGRAEQDFIRAQNCKMSTTDRRARRNAPNAPSDAKCLKI